MTRPPRFDPVRRASLRGMGAIALAAAVPLGHAQADAAPVEATTTEGRLRGLRQDGVCVFRGVRYADPPLGPWRFRAAPPLSAWTGVRDALAWGFPSLQAPTGPMGVNEPASNEDCLFLNVWTPAVNDGGKRPVMFYCHGGGFVTGSGASVHQDPSRLVRDNEVVVVESNHRLGLLGYLFLADVLGEPYASAANPGLLDIVAALDWTRRNIHAFGGDPENLMIWGESGGGAKTSCLYAMPGAAAYFHKASIESGPGIRMTEREQANATTRWVLERLAISPRQAKRLLQVPAATLLQLQLNPPATAALTPTGGRKGIGATGLGGFGPVVDGKVLPSHPFDPRAPALSADKPLIVGSNHDEAVFMHLFSNDRSVFDLDEQGLVARLNAQYAEFGPRLYAAYRRSRPDASPAQIAIAIETAAFAGAGSIAIAERKASQGRAPVYLYQLTDHINASVPGTDYPIGAMHAADLRLKFDNLGPSEARTPSLTGEERATHAQAAKNMSRYWAAFAREGRPRAQGQPEWPAYELNSRATLMLEAHCHVAYDPYPEERFIWTEVP